MVLFSCVSLLPFPLFLSVLLPLLEKGVTSIVTLDRTIVRTAVFIFPLEYLFLELPNGTTLTLAVFQSTTTTWLSEARRKHFYANSIFEAQS
jgi:hypothetical protein